MAMRTFSLVLVLTALLAGCGAPPPVTYENVNRFDNTIARADTLVTITLQDIFSRVEKSQSLPRGGTMTVAELADELDRMLVDTLAGLASDAVDLTRHWEYNRLSRSRYHDYLIRRFGQLEIYDKVAVDSAAIDSFYAAEPERFTRKEQISARHILITPFGMKYTADSLRLRALPPESLEVAAEQHAWKIKGMLDEGASFEDVAREYSHDSQARARAGFLGWVERGRIEDPFDSVAFALDSGQYCDPYRSANGWHIVLVERRRPESLAPLDSGLRSQIERHLRTKGADAAARPLIDSLDREMRLTVNETVLDTNIYLVEKSLWAGIVNDVDTIECVDLHMLEDAYRRRNKLDNTTPDMKRQMIREAARKFTLVQAARRAGIDTLPDVVAERRALDHQYRKVVYMLASRDDTWMPSDSLIEKYFAAHLADFEITKPLVVQQIVVPDSAVAEFVRDQAAAGADFLELADEYYPGEPGIRRALADLGEIGPGDVSPEFFETARATPVGMVSLPVKTQYGWHVIKVIEHRQPLSVGQARQKIVPVLKQEHQKEVFNAFRDDLYRRYNVTFPGRLYPLHFRSLAERGATEGPSNEEVNGESQATNEE